MKYPYVERVAIGFDQFVNTLFCGMPDETLSARAYRLSIERGKHWALRLINAIFFWQPNHCKTSYESEILRRQLPKHYQ